MPVGPESGVGRGSGFALGPATNVFNAATQAAGVTARDTYATNNATWLAQYDANPNLMVRVTWPVAATNVAYFARAASSWVEVTGVVRGPAGGKGDKGDAGLGVPAVTGADNGSVLRVVSGVWAKITSLPASIIGSGTFSASRIPTISLSKLATAVQNRLLPSGASTGQVAKWGGSAWVAADESGGGSNLSAATEAEAKAGTGTGYMTPGTNHSARAPRFQKVASLYSDTQSLADGSFQAFTNADGAASNALQAGGDLTNVKAITFSAKQGAFGTDQGAINPVRDAKDLEPLIDDRIARNSPLVLAMGFANATAYFQLDSFVRITSGSNAGYRCTVGDVHVSGDPGSWHGVSYNLVLGDWLRFTSDIVDVARLVEREALEGTEDDYYAEWDDSMLLDDNSDKRYGFTLASTSSGQPAAANVYNAIQDVVAGARTLAVGANAWTKIPSDNIGAVNPEKALATGDLDNPIHIASTGPGGGKNYLKVTPTAAATQVGSGNAAWWYMPVTVEVTGTPTEDQAGDVFRFSEEVPSDLDMDLDYRVIGNPPWARLDGSNVDERFKDSVRSPSDPYRLTGNYTRKGPLELAAAGQWAVSNAPVLNGAAVQIQFYFKSADTTFAVARWKVGNEIVIGAARFRLAGFPTKTATDQYQASVVLIAGALPALNAATAVEIQSDQPHRNEFIAQAFLANVPASGNYTLKAQDGVVGWVSD